MIRFSTLIDEFKKDCITDYGNRLKPNQIQALDAMQRCRNECSPVMQVNCSDCGHQMYVPHSCGNRSCPHCQHHECQRWIEQQVQKQVPAGYFMLTFTLPAQLRPLAWLFQALFYNMMFDCIWATLQTFSHNDQQLQGKPGVIAVLHTHSREHKYHPHIHVIMPAAAIDKHNVWRTKKGKRLFHYKALAKVFRAKIIDRMNKEKLAFPSNLPKVWNVHCKAVGGGDKAIIYLGRYLYRGVIAEKDILSCEDGQVTYRYKDSKSGHYKKKTLSGADFLWMILQHVLPKGFRRTRNYGFLHSNSKHSIKIVQFLLRFSPEKLLKPLRERPEMTCPCCGGTMHVVRTRIPKGNRIYPTPVPILISGTDAVM